METSTQYDAIVIGSGHNGLTCACYLAKAGLKVLVLEQYHSIGGMTNTEELTLPGFKSDTHAIGYQLANLSPTPDELNLGEYGFELLRPDPCCCHLFPDGRAVYLRRDIDETCKSIAEYSTADAETWRRLYERFESQEDEIRDSFYGAPTSPVEQLAALASSPGGLDAYRFHLQTFRSFANESLETAEAATLIGAWANHVGLSPDEAGGAEVAWLFCMLIQRFGNNAVKGGMVNLIRALARYLEEHGGEIRTNARVERIRVEREKAVAVRLSNGDEIDVRKLVASNVDPQQLTLSLLGPDIVGPEITRKMRRYELGESVLVVYLALDRPPQFKAGPLAGESIYAHVSEPTIDGFAEDFRQAREGLLPAAPFCLLANDYAADPSRVPAGKALMKVVVQPVPYEIQGDAAGQISGRSWDHVKEAFADRVVNLLTRNYIPDLKENIICRVVHSPVDIERLLPSSPRGTITHGAFSLYQMGAMRPIPELGHYKSPVSNVYLCGSGSHPGAGVSMAPGRSAAQVILKDLA